MKIVLPGSAGFVGRNLVRTLIKEGYDPNSLVVIDKDEKRVRNIEEHNVSVHLADLSESGDWMDKFKGADYVVNLAAEISSPDYDPFYRNNILATKNVLEACKEAGVRRIIHFSSVAVLSVRKDHYAQTKSDGERLVENSGLDYCILRPSIMYGPTNEENIGYLIDFSRRFPFFPIPGHGMWPRQPIYVDDVCRLVIAIMNDFPHNKVYNINGKDVVYFRDMVRDVQKQMDGFKFQLRLPVSLFKLLMLSYQKLTGNTQFTVDQVNSLTAEEIFPEYPWWEEFDIEVTSFEDGVRKMMSSES
jgi:nucleoside-diphosphate-sugar epimerase